MREPEACRLLHKLEYPNSNLSRILKASRDRVLLGHFQRLWSSNDTKSKVQGDAGLLKDSELLIIGCQDADATKGSSISRLATQRVGKR